MPQFLLQQIADLIEAELIGDAAAVVSSVAPLDQAQTGDLSFLSDKQFQAALAKTQATAVIISAADQAECQVNALIVKNPHVAFAKIARHFVEDQSIETGVHASAVIDQTAQLGAEVFIGANVVIGANVIIGNHVIIEASSVIQAGVHIGDHSRLHANVTLYPRVILGQRVEVHAGAVIGADGFGLARDEQGAWLKVPQLGSVIIEDNVEIGANTTIDRGALGDTLICEGAKLDNQIQIAHNVKIGKHTAIAACVGIAGSTEIGAHCMIAGGVGMQGHIKLADGVVISAMSGVGSSITEPGIYSSGMPAMPHMQWQKRVAYIRKLDDLNKRVKHLEKDNE